MKKINEEINSVGTGQIAGVGVGKDGEPGIKKVIKNKKRKLRDIVLFANMKEQ